LVVDVVSVHPVVPLGVPMPSPRATADEALSFTSVTLTAPVCETVNVPATTLACWAKVPENVSVFEDGDDGEFKFGSNPQPALSTRQRRHATPRTVRDEVEPGEDETSDQVMMGSYRTIAAATLMVGDSRRLRTRCSRIVHRLIARPGPS
jgi:hypothetical protein